MRRIAHAKNGLHFASSPPSQYGRTAAYRRLLTQDHSQPPSPRLLSSIATRPEISLLQIRFPKSLAGTYTGIRLPQPTRPLYTSIPRFQQPRPAEDVKDPPREEQSSEARAEEADRPSSEENGKSESTGDGSSEPKKESKEDLPPPPPHGDKTPWQVFTETLRQEFKASKEWNDSTKQLASSAHQFTESEGVRKARAAYDATAGAATTKTATAIKSTGRALGQGAAWTWDTRVVQGIREGVNATGRGIEKATRPVRETETFQNIKEAVDDGSSSRYGGWVEKEERRKKREQREIKEMKSGRRPMENMEEDPKYAFTPLRSPLLDKEVTNLSPF